MGKVIEIKFDVLYTNSKVADVLSKKDFDVFVEVVGAYFELRLYQLRHKIPSVTRDIHIINDFVVFSRKAPWEWTEIDFLAWSKKLVAKKEIAIASQRHYQGVIKRFIQFCIDSLGVKTLIQDEYGISVRQICHVETMIAHCYEREISKERPCPQYKEMQRIFDTYDEEIDIAENHGSKDFFPLQRDLALFTLIFGAGLRISEALLLNVTSFMRNPKRPDLGDFGSMVVMGKASAGQDKKPRTAYLYNANHAETLEWYLEEIRPYFLRNAHLNETAMFLSERGSRLLRSTAEARFKHILELANMADRGFTIHGLRHAHITQTVMLVSPHTVQMNVGHINLSTTQQYTHVLPKFMDYEIQKAADWNIRGSIRNPYANADKNTPKE